MSVGPEYAIQRACKQLDALINDVLSMRAVDSRSLARKLNEIRGGLTPQATGNDLEDVRAIGAQR